jgi:hypothetical protein
MLSGYTRYKGSPSPKLQNKMLTAKNLNSIV